MQPAPSQLARPPGGGGADALSEQTVQDHLKSIFAKTAAHDRVTVVSRALGTRR
jgi:hypothetical protein